MYSASRLKFSFWIKLSPFERKRVELIMLTNSQKIVIYIAGFFFKDIALSIKERLAMSR